MSAAASLDPIYDLAILSTDFVPDEMQTHLLKGKVANGKELLTLMNTELQGLRLRIGELHNRIGEVEGTLMLDEALLSPSRRLAPETLAQVFMHCLPMDPVITLCPTVAPLLLAHVSRRWRRMACGTPHLWEKLYLGRGFSRQLHTLVPLWLANSGIIPIDIRIGLQDWQFDFNHRLVERDLAHLLLPSVYRCRSLSGTLSTSAIEILFGHDLLMPYLQDLDLGLPGWSPVAVPNLGSLRAPLLQQINLNNTGFVTKALHGPFPSVQRLQLTGQETLGPGLLSHSRCLDFIALCTNLQSCILTLSKDPGMPLHHPILLESLFHLHLIFQFSPHDPVPFLMALHTPRIERLTLQNHGGVSPVPHIRRVLNLLLCRPHNIRELNLSSLFVPTSDWVPSLSELTELTSLSIIGDSLDENFFDFLTGYNPLIPRICPNLVALKLHHVTGLVGLSGDRLVAFIRSRAPLNHEGPRELADGCKYVRYVSLVLCDMENRHRDELRDIERECGGALHLQGLDPSPSSSGTTHGWSDPVLDESVALT